MEIEAKFTLADAESIQHYRIITQLAGFPLGKERIAEIHDTYVDTPERKILNAGFSCRFRQGIEGLRITLKTIDVESGVIHKRQEKEFLLPEMQPVEKWPDNPVRKTLLKMTNGDDLLPLFDLYQTRIVRMIRWHAQTIAELSLDEVQGATGAGEQKYYELEVELVSQENEEQFIKLVKFLQEKHHLHPQHLSKFERALSQLDQKSGHSLLNPDEQAILSGIAKREDWYGLQSRALLALDQGLSNADTGKQVGRSIRSIRRWLAEFQAARTGIYPENVLQDARSSLLPSQKQVPDVEVPLEKPPALVPRKPRNKPPARVGLLSDDLMPEAVRKIMYFQFQHMLFHEAGTRLGEDIEELHDMRVATRRMRAALKVFGEFLNEKTWAAFDKRLRQTGNALGKVRDLDVFWDKTQRYIDSLPVERKDELAPLQAAWTIAHNQARDSLLAYLDGKRYQKFKESFGQFLETGSDEIQAGSDDLGIPKPMRLKHVAPVILYQGLSAINAFEEWMVGSNVPLARLHQLRIASKGLRYALEFFKEVLGTPAAALIKEMKTLQDHLGDLQDAVVASNLLRDFLTWGNWDKSQAETGLRRPITPVVAPGVVSYLAFRQAELQNLPASLPLTWARLQSREFKHNFNAAIENL